MYKAKLLGALAIAALLGACSTVVASGGQPLHPLPVDAVKSPQSAGWHVADIRVNVPDDLTVSEANQYLPIADIVWHGDPYGDRRAQVKGIVAMAISQAAIGLSGSQAVDLDVTLKRFHALSQKARATFGGWHTIIFDVSIRDKVTGIQLAGPFEVKINLTAYGGQRAITAEMRGQTQKLRISHEITRIMRQYLGVA